MTQHAQNRVLHGCGRFKGTQAAGSTMADEIWVAYMRRVQAHVGLNGLNTIGAYIPWPHATLTYAVPGDFKRFLSVQLHSVFSFDTDSILLIVGACTWVA